MPAVPTTSHQSFARETGAALLLVAAAQWLFYAERLGATLGVFVLGWCAVLVASVPRLRRGAAAGALAAAAALALALVDDPGPLGWTLCWTALVSAALLSRLSFDDAASWAVRLASMAFLGVVDVARDAARVVGRRGAGGVSVASVAAVLALPLIGGALFLALFALANPVIAVAFASLSLPSAAEIALHLLFWSVVLVAVWPTLRPRAARLAGGMIRERRPLDLPVATVTLSLAAFNAVFAVENALDLAFLWSGAALPAGVTLAAYAHRGAYTLIATALLAGAFVLVALAPGSGAARSPTVRWLITLWIAQNLLLVASSILRLLDYIAAYSLTELRIAALAWMGLVASGLALICWRLLAGKSAAWLVNANALSAAIVLIATDVVDLGAVAARWNVDHARRAEQLDLCYISSLGASALLPLIDLERRAAGPVLRDRSRYLRRAILADLAARQADWRGWTWRGSRRLAAARALVGADTAPVRPAPNSRTCNGSILPPPAAAPSPAPSAATPLTNAPDAMILCPMPRTILVVDDDPHIRQVLAFALGKAGLDTLEAEDGEAALRLAATASPDLVILDINMPRMDGLEACRRLRAAGDLPILFVSSRDDEIDRVLGIELGADDYVVKPFSPREVVARVMAILRRASARAPAVDHAAAAISHGRLAIDLDAWRSAWAGAEVALTVTEFSILRTLASMPAKVFSRDAIIDRLHGPGFAITDRTVDSHVRNLRAKFAAVGGGDVVETRPGIGYRLGACAGG